MEHEAAADIAEDCLLDASKDCQDCANSRLIDRQRALIQAQEESLRLKNQKIGALELQVKALKDELEIERGRNRVLGFQIRTLREGK